MTNTTGNGESEMVERLARIEEKLTGVLDHVKDHETKLRKLERASWVLAGAAVATAGSGIGGSLLGLFGG